MIVKQIDVKTGLNLAIKGETVMVLVPGEDDPLWEKMTPDTLQHMLEGCMFFRREPAAEVDLIGETKSSFDSAVPPTADHETASGSSGSAKKPAAGCVGSRRKKVTVDEGKLLALRKAGWSMKKIADELKISEGSVFNYLKKMEGEHGTINT